MRQIAVLTKGIYSKELLKKEIYGDINEYGITLVSLNDDFKRRFEPFSAPFLQRIKGLKRLHDAGLKTWVSIEPYPTPNIVNQDLKEILNKIAFVDKIIFGRWNYNAITSQYNDDKRYYDDCAELVHSFCKKSGTGCYFKHGTITNKKYLENKIAPRGIFTSN